MDITPKILGLLNEIKVGNYGIKISDRISGPLNVKLN